MRSDAKVVHRLERGDFLGVISVHKYGAWAGWYAVSWTAGNEVGGSKASGLRSALAQLEADYMRWLAKRQAAM